MAETQCTVSQVRSGTADILVLTHSLFQKQTMLPGDVLSLATLRRGILLQPHKYSLHL